ncbi:hypothetical protein IWZ03DRAFT_195144 [Phyllosticta citriasiana]|uniref:Uncharacterized protein n=1 Tax=Phyllosticta citriasiana TaxID=595635 RepID=A0ABR1KLF7_9PEZI
MSHFERLCLTGTAEPELFGMMIPHLDQKPSIDHCIFLLKLGAHSLHQRWTSHAFFFSDWSSRAFQRCIERLLFLAFGIMMMTRHMHGLKWRSVSLSACWIWAWTRAHLVLSTLLFSTSCSWDTLHGPGKSYQLWMRKCVCCLDGLKMIHVLQLSPRVTTSNRSDDRNEFQPSVFFLVGYGEHGGGALITAGAYETT